MLVVSDVRAAFNCCAVVEFIPRMARDPLMAALLPNVDWAEDQELGRHLSTPLRNVQRFIPSVVKRIVRRRENAPAFSVLRRVRSEMVQPGPCADHVSETLCVRVPSLTLSAPKYPHQI